MTFRSLLMPFWPQLLSNSCWFLARDLRLEVLPASSWRALKSWQVWKSLSGQPIWLPIGRSCDKDKKARWPSPCRAVFARSRREECGKLTLGPKLSSLLGIDCGGWLWGGVVLPEPSIFILSWVSQCLVHTQLSQHLGSDFACQSWEERMVTLRSHDTWGIGHWLGEGEPFWFQDSSCLGWNFRNSHRLRPRLQSRHIFQPRPMGHRQDLAKLGKLKQLLIQQLYELIKAAIPINLLAALKYLPFQPGDWEKGWESLGETLGPLGHWYPQVWDGDYALLSHVA